MSKSSVYVTRPAIVKVNGKVWFTVFTTEALALSKDESFTFFSLHLCSICQYCIAMNASLSGKTMNISQENGSVADFSVFTAIQLVCLPLIIVAGLIGNTLICVAVWKRAKLRTIDYYILNLAATDLGTCIISVPFDFVEILAARWPFGAALCKMVYPFQTVLLAVSVYTLLCMSLERYRAVIRPFKPKMKGKKTFGIIIFGWISALSLVSPYITTLNIQDGVCSETWNAMYSRMFTLFVFVFEYLLPLFLITGAYVKISQKLWKDIKRIRKVTGTRERERKTRARARTHRNMRIVKIFVFAVVTFAFCMLPTHVMWMWSGFGNGSDYQHFKDILVFCHILVYCNSAINPFIFVFLHNRYCRDLCICCPFLLLIKMCTMSKRRRLLQTLSSSRTQSSKRLPYTMQHRSPHNYEKANEFGDSWRVERRFYSPRNMPQLTKEQRYELHNPVRNHEKFQTTEERRQRVNFGGTKVMQFTVDKKRDRSIESL